MKRSRAEQAQKGAAKASGRQTGRQRDRRTGRQRDRQTGRPGDRQIKVTTGQHVALPVAFVAFSFSCKLGLPLKACASPQSAAA